jgi:uncharacterized protein YbjT (DUF2867 family)
MSILVIGGTGLVGREVLHALSRSGYPTRALVRTVKARLPAGIDPIVGDLADPNSLEPALQGASRVFLLNALVEDETAQGLAAVAAAKRAGICRIVFLSVHQYETCQHIPHFATKRPIVEAIKTSGMDWAILEPSNFFQNDSAWFTHAILKASVYPQPIGGKGVSRVDIRDIADAAVNCLTKDGFTGHHWPLVGPEALTGAMVADAYTRLLGRSVTYAGDDLQAWDMAFKPFLPDRLRHDFQVMYRHFQTEGLIASAEDLARCRQILGHSPRSFAQYLEEVFAPIAARLAA